MTTRSLCAIAGAAALSCGHRAPPAPAPAGSPLALGNLTLTVPAAWAAQPVSSSMRKAQYQLPAAPGDAHPAELVVYYFGAGGAGSVDDNLERWYGQFEQPDGRPSREAARVEQLTAGGVAVTVVDLNGRYVAQMSPGAGQRHDEPGFRMLGAIFDGGEGAYYVKVVGPEQTVARWREDFFAMLRSLRKS